MPLLPCLPSYLHRIDASNSCFAEFGAVDANNPRNTAVSHLNYRSCMFEDIGPAEIAARDVTFSATNTFAAETGEVSSLCRQRSTSSPN